MSKLPFFSAVVLIVLLSTGCSSMQTNIVPEATIPSIEPSATALIKIDTQPTSTANPTQTLPPTETASPTNTALPPGVIFRDDFNGSLQPGWTWENENKDKWTFTDDGMLQIIGQGESLLIENRQYNLLWLELPPGEFVVTVHLITKPFQDFHQAAIFLYEDPKNYVTINRGFCSPCATGGNGFFMDYKVSGAWGDYNYKTEATDVYLRLESKGQTISGYFATEPGNWQRLGRFGNYFTFKKVGLGVSNCRSSSDVLALFDYFEVSE